VLVSPRRCRQPRAPDWRNRYRPLLRSAKLDS